MHFVGVVAALASDDRIQRREAIDRARVFERCDGAADIRTLAADGGRAEKHRLDLVEIALRPHALQQHRTDHPPPAYESHPPDCGHLRSSVASSAATTASPIAAVPMRAAPVAAMSAVRKPRRRTVRTACSVRAAAAS